MVTSGWNGAAWIGAGLAAACLSGGASGQVGDLLVSTSSDDVLVNGVAASDEVVVRIGAEDGGHPVVPGETWAAHFGEGGGSLHLLPGDVDALHDPGEAGPGGGLLFSLVSDLGDVEDGDVLRLVDGGVEVAWAEADLVAALGATDGNVDVDALHLESDGSLLLSLAEDEGSAVLSGDTPGEVADGAVLRWAPAAGTVSLVATESEIAALVQTALGGSASPGDVKSLARHPVDGSLLFSVQSPSAHDGSVFRWVNGGEVLDGHAEADLGFTGGGELDALSIARSSWPGLDADVMRPQPGETVTLTLRGVTPGSAWLLLFAQDLAPSWVTLPGWGGLVLADDPALGLAAMLSPWLASAADGQGTATWSFPLPVGTTPDDLVLQAFALAAGHEASNPILLEVAQ